MEAPAQNVEAASSAKPLPTPRQYWQIFAVLAITTGIEIGLSYSFEIFGDFVVPMLLVAGAFKFLLVVGFYMHLRYENPMLSRFFGGGFTLAIFLYAVVLATFGALGVFFG